jgi:hypothetical protein
MPNAPAEVQEPNQKIKISYEEYEKISFMIIKTMKDFEDAGEEMVAQNKIVDKVVLDIEIGQKDETSLEQTEITAKKVNSTIQQLITKEGMVIIDKDAKNRTDRILSLDVNIDLGNMQELA